MADQTTPPPPPPKQQGGLQIPADVLKKFGDLIGLIKESESMNDEERQYWINILPIMTPEQLQNLRDILDNEKRQLAAIDAKYQNQLSSAAQEELVKRTEEERRKRRTERQSKEQAHTTEDAAATEDLLKKMENL